MVGSGARKARAISSVVRPPISRSVSATRASVDSTGWQAVNIRRSRSSPMSSSSASSMCSSAVSCSASRSRPISACLRSASLCRRSRSIARRLAVVISHAPGLSGMPDAGHCSSAATSASCASSSASRRRAPCGPGRRSASPARSARPRRWRDGCRRRGCIGSHRGYRYTIFEAQARRCGGQKSATALRLPLGELLIHVLAPRLLARRPARAA